MANPAVIALAHDPAYVDDFIGGRLTPQAIRRIGFPWSEGLVRRTLASVGGTLAACDDALATGWGGNLAGGTHHAFFAEGSGFCVFNDIAVAIRTLQQQGRIRRAAVVDLDVHQGDGTAQIFEDDPDVLTLSFHGAGNFPFRKRRSTVDVAFPDGTEDEQYLAALDSALPRVMEFQPDFVFYQSGVDGLASDTLGKLKLTKEGLARRDRLVMAACRNAGLPLVITLGGGYSNPLDFTADAHAQVFEIAADYFGSTRASLATAG
jgi:acetoin utilization deacetylase AcuC-like enzyme